MESSYSSISSSNIIESDFFTESDLITEYIELPTEGNFNRIHKIKRYGQWFILKSLKPEYAVQTLYVKLLQKEFELGASLDHPFIVKTISKENNPQLGPSIMLEYIDGITLKEFLGTQPSQQIRKRIVAQLLEVMQYIHSKQVVHRDLKPSNIMITHNGFNVKIIDFGLADADSFTVFKQPAGTKKYAAPEQLVVGGVVDNRTDIYALGKIIHEIFPNKYKRITRKCTQHDPNKRYADVEDLFAAFLHQKRMLHSLIILLLVVLFAVLSFFTFQYLHSTFQAQEKAKMEAAALRESHEFIDSVYAPIYQRIQQGEYNYSEFASIDIQNTYPIVKEHCHSYATLYADTTAFYSQLTSAFHLKWGKVLQDLDERLDSIPSFYNEYTQRRLPETQFKELERKFKRESPLFK